MGDTDVAYTQMLLLDEPQLYHAATSGPAYFGTLVKQSEAPPKSWCYHVEQMPTFLRGVDRRFDTFISQGEFFRARRRIATLRSIGLVWADLDDPALCAFGDAYAVDNILRIIDEQRIPAPSLIVASGRGYHCKWLFENNVPWQALDRWSALEKTIVSGLRESLAADVNCVDAARVLRLVGTTNTKVGTVAKIAWTNTVNGEVVRYPFDRLCDEVFEYRRPSHHTRRGEFIVKPEPVTAKARATTQTHYTQASLWWGRFRDIRRLCELRGWNGERGVPVGYRDQVLFLAATSLTWFAPRKTWWFETQALATTLTPTLDAAEWRSYLGSTWLRMQQTIATGVEHRYRYGTARIIRDLAISAEEQAVLEVLVDPAIAHERKLANDRKGDEKRRRAAGAVEREVYIGRAAERAHAARELAGSGLSYAEIAERLGVSRRHAIRLVTSPSRCIGVAEPPPEGPGS